MEILSLADFGVKGCAERAAEVIGRGWLVLYPTDTLYALGTDAFSDDAVGKIYNIKGRSELKPIHAIVADIEMAEQYAELNKEARVILKDLPTGKLTLIAKKKNANTGIARGVDTFGFRIPDNEFCISLARAFGPITATSANKSGQKPEYDVERIIDQLGEGSSLIDLVIDGGDLLAGWTERKPSTVVDITGDRPIIIREGAIVASDFWNAIREEQSE